MQTRNAALIVFIMLAVWFSWMFRYETATWTPIQGGYDPSLTISVPVWDRWTHTFCLARGNDGSHEALIKCPITLNTKLVK